jgi:ribosome-binding protein aMBF1 (putative translation factor)
MSSGLQASMRNYQETSKGIAHEFRLSVGEAIIEGLREIGWNQKKLAEQLGVTEPLISRFLNGDHNWTSESVGKIGHALKIRFRAKAMPLRSMAQKADTSRRFTRRPARISPPKRPVGS